MFTMEKSQVVENSLFGCLNFLACDVNKCSYKYEDMNSCHKIGVERVQSTMGVLSYPHVGRVLHYIEGKWEPENKGTINVKLFLPIIYSDRAARMSPQNCFHALPCDAQKLDGVGPVDDRPSTDKLHHFVRRKKN